MRQTSGTRDVYKRQMLHEAKVGGDAIEEERVEQRAIFGRKLRIDAFEGPAVIGPEIRCRAHAAEKNGNVAIGEALQDRLDRGARHQMCIRDRIKAR